MYRKKYIKYKTKYLRLLNGSGQRGGARKNTVTCSENMVPSANIVFKNTQFRTYETGADGDCLYHVISCGLTKPPITQEFRQTIIDRYSLTNLDVAGLRKLAANRINNMDPIAFVAHLYDLYKPSIAGVLQDISFDDLLLGTKNNSFETFLGLMKIQKKFKIQYLQDSTRSIQYNHDNPPKYDIVLGDYGNVNINVKYDNKIEDVYISQENINTIKDNYQDLLQRFGIYGTDVDISRLSKLLNIYFFVIQQQVNGSFRYYPIDNCPYNESTYIMFIYHLGAHYQLLSLLIDDKYTFICTKGTFPEILKDDIPHYEEPGGGAGKDDNATLQPSNNIGLSSVPQSDNININTSYLNDFYTGKKIIYALDIYDYMATYRTYGVNLSSPKPQNLMINSIKNPHIIPASSYTWVLIGQATPIKNIPCPNDDGKGRQQVNATTIKNLTLKLDFCNVALDEIESCAHDCLFGNNDNKMRMMNDYYKFFMGGEMFIWRHDKKTDIIISDESGKMPYLHCFDETILSVNSSILLELGQLIVREIAKLSDDTLWLTVHHRIGKTNNHSAVYRSVYDKEEDTFIDTINSMQKYHNNSEFKMGIGDIYVGSEGIPGHFDLKSIKIYIDKQEQATREAQEQERVAQEAEAQAQAEQVARAAQAAKAKAEAEAKARAEAEAKARAEAEADARVEAEAEARAEAEAKTRAAHAAHAARDAEEQRTQATRVTQERDAQAAEAQAKREAKAAEAKAAEAEARERARDAQEQAERRVQEQAAREAEREAERVAQAERAAQERAQAAAREEQAREERTRAAREVQEQAARSQERVIAKTNKTSALPVRYENIPAITSPAITMTLNVPYNTFNKDKFAKVLASLLGIRENKINVKDVKPGSVIITFEFVTNNVEQHKKFVNLLTTATQSGKLEVLSVKTLSIDNKAITIPKRKIYYPDMQSTTKPVSSHNYRERPIDISNPKKYLNKYVSIHFRPNIQNSRIPKFFDRETVWYFDGQQIIDYGKVIKELNSASALEQFYNMGLLTGSRVYLVRMSNGDEIRADDTNLVHSYELDAFS